MAKLIGKRIKDLKEFLDRLVSPKSESDDRFKKERILNVLLVSTIILSGIASLTAAISYQMAVDNHHLYKGLNGWDMILVVVSFLVLYLWLKKGNSKKVAYVFILFFFFSATYITYKWGANVPQAILIDSLTIVMAGILINTRFAFNMVLLIMLSSFILLDLEQKGIIEYNLLWATKPPEINDIIINSLTFLVLAVVSWLSNRELELALEKAKKSEIELKKEKNSLESEVEKRVEELKRVQLERIVNLYKFADFGRLTAGLFHDIANPLTQVSLNLTNIEYQTKNKISAELNKVNPAIKRAIEGTKQMERLIVSVRKQVQQQESNGVYRPLEEIETVAKNFEYRAKEAKIKIIITGKKEIQTYGNPIRFYQLLSNFISNAMDSYYEIEREENRKIIIGLDTNKNQIIVTIKDFGCGIPKKIMGKIFEPLFTTKDSKRGTGIGLSISQKIVEQELEGTIEVRSAVNKGTIFTIKFPIKNKPDAE